jgi:hypothetical protein
VAASERLPVSYLEGVVGTQLGILADLGERRDRSLQQYSSTVASSSHKFQKQNVQQQHTSTVPITKCSLLLTAAYYAFAINR